MKSNETSLKDELATEHERRVRAEYRCEVLSKKL